MQHAPITPKQETGIALLFLAIVIIILMTCLSCKASKHTLSKVCGTETLDAKHERLSTTHQIDSISQKWLLKADSIIISFRYDYKSAGDRPTTALCLHQIAVGDNTGKAAGKPANKWKEDGRPWQATTAHPPSPRPSQATFKVYAPHIAASSDEKSVDNNSSVDSSNKSLQSTIEESCQQNTVPSTKSLFIKIIFTTIIITSIIISACIFIKKSK